MPRSDSPLTKENQLYQAFWRQALTNGKQGLTLPCKTQAEASRLRFALYNSVRAFKQGKVQPDQELAEAIANVTITFTEDKKGLQLTNRLDSGLLSELAKLIPKEKIVNAEELASREALKRMEERLGGVVTADPAKPSNPAMPTGLTAGSSTPYYTRER